jgi:hypothetical protein
LDSVGGKGIEGITNETTALWRRLPGRLDDLQSKECGTAKHRRISLEDIRIKLHRVMPIKTFEPSVATSIEGRSPA